MAIQGSYFVRSLVSCLHYHLFLLSKTSILQAISKEKIILNHCAGMGMKTVMLKLQLITLAIILKKN